MTGVRAAAYGLIAIAGLAASSVAVGAPVAEASPRGAGAGAESDGAWTRVPLPDGTVMYVRYGPPGGVRIRSGGAVPVRAGAAVADTAAASDSLVAVVREILREELRAMGFPRPPASRSEASMPPWPRKAPPIGRGAHGPITVVIPSPEPEPVTPGSREAAGTAGAPAEPLVAPGSVPPTSSIPPGEPSTKPLVGVPPSVGAGDTVRAPEVAEPTTTLTPRVIRQAFLEPGLLRTNLILFETGKTILLPISRETLLTIAQVLAGYPEARIEVAGHTDSRGSAEMNQQLSRRRAEAVREFLIGEGGLAADRVVARGYGESDPVASNATETGRALNRRVEFRVLNPEALVR